MYERLRRGLGDFLAELRPTVALFVRFGLNAANVGGNEDEVRPTAMIPVLEIGLQKAEKETNIAVDAGKVNPRPITGKLRKAPN